MLPKITFEKIIFEFVYNLRYLNLAGMQHNSKPNGNIAFQIVHHPMSEKIYDIR